MSRRHRKPAPLAAGHEGRFEPGLRVVEDPYELGAKLEVAVNVRHDVLLHWTSRGAIDEAQLAAGRKLQSIHARAEIGGAASLDYSKPLVDGGRLQEPLTDRVMHASSELIALRPVLGQTDFLLLIRVVCLGRTIAEEARGWGGRDPEKYLARRVRDGLTVLAEHWGAKGKERGTIVAERYS